MQRRSGWGAVALSLATLGACVVPEPPAEAVMTQALVDGPCPEEVCGSNSPVIDSLGFHELNLRGAPNAEGFAIAALNGVAQIVKGSSSYNLHVVGNMIVGRRFPFFTLSGTQLIGAYIPIRNVRTGGQYKLFIRGVSTMNYFVPAPPPPQPPPSSFEGYTFKWSSVTAGDNERALCDNIEGLRKFLREQQGDNHEGGATELMGLDVIESVVFEGDRIYTGPKKMEPLANDLWFNIGCAGHTLAKLLLTRNTVHSQRPGLTRAWEQRQATLKMLVCDVCGTGQPFTVFGEGLFWKGDLMSFFGPPASLEARWNENGAICLHKPRLDVPSTQLGEDLFPNVSQQIMDTCTVVPCMNLNPHDLAGADRVSANPQ